MALHRFLAPAMGVLALAGGAAGQVHSGDILLKLENGRLVTGMEEKGGPVFPVRVFSGIFGEGGIPNVTFEPGFDSETGALPPTTVAGVTIRRALRRWTGGDFSLIPVERLEIVKNNITITTPITNPPSCGVGESLPLGQTSSAGHLHQHAAFRLTSPFGDGVYLLELEAWLAEPGAAASEPFWIVFDQNTPASLVAAFEWAEANLPGGGCDANCDGSTAPPILNVNDFICFQARFAAGDCGANCDGSTAAPVLNVNDFICFQALFAAGCR